MNDVINSIDSRLIALEQKVVSLEATIAVLEARIETYDEDFAALSERVRDLENLADDGYSVEDYG